MDEAIKKQTLGLLSKSQTISIVVSQKSGFDGLASGLALYLSLKKAGKNPTISASNPTVGDARSLYSVDKINKEKSQKDLVINIPNAIQNVDKVSYNIKENQLKITIHSLPNSVGIPSEDVTFEKSNIKTDLIVSIGFESLEQLKTEYTHEQLIGSDSLIINVNSGNLNQKFAQINIISPTSSCISESIVNFIIQLGLPLDEDAAFNLYSGIKNATNMFSPINTKETTLQTAQHLIKLGAGKTTLAAKESSIRILRGRESSQIPSQPRLQAENLAALSQKISQSYTNPDKIARSRKIGAKSKPISAPLYRDAGGTPLEKVEAKEGGKQSWLKPPKVYRGSKSFDRES